MLPDDGCPVYCACQNGEPLPELEFKPLTNSEISGLFPEEDKSLLGNRIAALTEAIGIPPCGGCGKRKEWLNKAHLWLRGELG